MRQTPKPWVVGGDGIVAPSVPYEQSSDYAYFLSSRARGYQVRSRALGYQGELVCEGASFADRVDIVHATRSLPILLETLERILTAPSLSEVQSFAATSRAYVLSLKPAIEAEGRANEDLSKWAGCIEWSDPIRGYLPETATRERLEPSRPAYLPLRCVYDNIELAWIYATPGCDIPF